MKNADMPAMPVMDGDNEPANLSHSYYQNLQLATGLTKREMMAMNAMVGLLSGDAGSECSYSPTVLANDSVRYADALLAELERTSK